MPEATLVGLRRPMVTVGRFGLTTLGWEKLTQETVAFVRFKFSGKLFDKAQN